jgi:hypothetical protein
MRRVKERDKEIKIMIIKQKVSWIEREGYRRGRRGYRKEEWERGLGEGG